MREAIDVDDYCAALLTWATTKSSSDSEIPDHARKEALAALRSGCDFLRASRAGSARIQDLCHAMRDWADSQPEGSFLALLSADAPKSCLLFRLIYAGERLRTHPCPIHKGRWSGCSTEPCPAGCSSEGNVTGWLPEHVPA